MSRKSCVEAVMRPKGPISQLHLRLDGNGGPGFISGMIHPFALMAKNAGRTCRGRTRCALI